MDTPLSSSTSSVWRWSVLIASAAAIFLFDQTAKALIMERLKVGETLVPIPALANVITFTLSRNTGAAFSILPQAGDLFLLIALGLIISIPFFYHRIPPGHWLERIAIGVLLGGVSGNALDRIRLGYVVDFVHLPFIGNVSNFADHAIVLSILVLFVSQWGTPEKPVPEEKSGG